MRYTNISGQTVMVCDHCREDIPLGNQALTVAPGKIDEGFVARDYTKGEMILCPTCANALVQVLTLLGAKRCNGLFLLQEAA